MVTVWSRNWRPSKLIRRTFMTGSSKTLSPFIEEKYQRLLDQFKLRDDLIRLQKFILTWRMTLHRLGVPESNVRSLDLRDGHRLVGVWLLKHDYAGKLRRKEQARVALQLAHEQARENDERVPWGPAKVKPVGGHWDRADYVVFDPTLYPPANWLEACQVKI
jgi:hypothetical protein